MSLARYISRRLLISIVQLAVLIVGTFLLMRVLPGDPVILRLGAMATPESIAKVRHDMGLDLPLMTQLGNYVRQVLSGDLGHSWRTANAVTSDLLMRVPATVALAATRARSRRMRPTDCWRIPGTWDRAAGLARTNPGEPAAAWLISRRIRWWSMARSWPPAARAGAGPIFRPAVGRVERSGWTSAR